MVTISTCRARQNPWCKRVAAYQGWRRSIHAPSGYVAFGGSKALHRRSGHCAVEPQQLIIPAQKYGLIDGSRNNDDRIGQF